MGRKVITMAKELGTEAARYLLHSIDQIVAEETVVGGRAMTGYSNAPWKALMRSQTSVRSSLKSGQGVEGEGEDDGGQSERKRKKKDTVEILQIQARPGDPGNGPTQLTARGRGHTQWPAAAQCKLPPDHSSERGQWGGDDGVFGDEKTGPIGRGFG